MSQNNKANKRPLIVKALYKITQFGKNPEDRVKIQSFHKLVNDLQNEYGMLSCRVKGIKYAYIIEPPQKPRYGWTNIKV